MTLNEFKDAILAEAGLDWDTTTLMVEVGDEGVLEPVYHIYLEKDSLGNQYIRIRHLEPEQVVFKKSLKLA